MNEPLKHKVFSVYGQLLNEKILQGSWNHVKKNKGCEGIDKVSIKKFDQNKEGKVEKTQQRNNSLNGPTQNKE